MFHKYSSYFTENTNPCRQVKTIITISKNKFRKRITLVLGPIYIYIYSEGSEEGNLHQLSVTMSKTTYFSLRANTGAGVSRSRRRKNSGEVLKKMQVNGPGG